MLLFDHTFASRLSELCVEWSAAVAPRPALLAVNDALAAEIGIDLDWLHSDDALGVMVGNVVAATSSPVAMAYAGHQFGTYSPRLGDGRALLLGEFIGVDGQRRDLHLKGSGRTPFARGGDGKAAVAPMLRELLIGEAMHALRIPTTRGLAVVTTGEHIAREGMVPGAVLARVAASHLRVGTFEYAARMGDGDLLRRLADYSIARHYPTAADQPDPYRAFYAEVVEAQAALVASWMLVGFVHGVMNTDNTTISGESIDYGPCAFIDAYDPATVFSSIDHGGRYAFGRQPSIIQWNLARLGETLLPLLADDADAAVEVATEVLTSLPDRFTTHWRAGMASKLGLIDVVAGDEQLFEDLLAVMHEQSADFTLTFRSLAAALSPPAAELPPGFEPWIDRWRMRLASEGRPHDVVAAAMNATNPAYIPRNHLVEEALEAAQGGDMSAFDHLLEVVTNPFETRPEHERYGAPAPASFGRYFQTFCGT